MPVAQEVSREWLQSVLASGGYDVTQSDNVLLARHSSRANLVVTLRKENDIISFRHYWGTKVGFGKDKDFRAAINNANRTSWYDTFYVDDEGNLNVSFYIALTESLGERDILSFLEKEWSSFSGVTAASGLAAFVK